MTPGSVAVLAHRGASASAPENTLVAFAQAVQDGADVIELDVRLTQDGHPVVLHDDTLDRTTNGRGPLAGCSLARLRALDAGGWFSPRFAGERVPLLDEALAFAAERGVGLNVELKGIGGDPAPLAAAVARALARHPLGRGQVLVSSFSFPLLEAFAERAPGVPLAPLVLGVPADPALLLLDGRAEAVHPSWAGLTPVGVRRLQGLGLRVHPWTVDRAEDLRAAVAWGVDGIITNHPRRLRALLDGR